MKKVLLLLILALASCNKLKFENLGGIGGIIAGFKNAGNLLSSISDTYGNLVSVIGCSSSKNLKAMWRNEGFAYLNIHGTTKRSVGIMDGYFERWKKSMIRQNKIPNDLQESFNAFLVDESESESTTWGKTEIIFSDRNSNNQLRVLNFYINHRDDNKHDAAYINIMVRFTKAPNTEIWSKSRSFVGGAYSDVKDQIKKTNASMNAQDVQDLLDIVRLLSLNFFGNSIGLNLKLPKI